MVQPIAGWYADPDDAQQVRWWNGVCWAEFWQSRSAHPAPVLARV